MSDLEPKSPQNDKDKDSKPSPILLGIMVSLLGYAGVCLFLWRIEPFSVFFLATGLGAACGSYTRREKPNWFIVLLINSFSIIIVIVITQMMQENRFAFNIVSYMVTFLLALLESSLDD